MCIIAAKPAGVKMPKDEYIYNMFENNDDGAGFMYAVGGKVYIQKGYMQYADFLDAIEKLGAKYDLEKLPLVMHFRITTSGGTRPENCHPFPITDSIGMLKKLRSSTKLGVAHNGIIDITTTKETSDTMEYIVSQLSPLSRAVPKFYRDKNLMKMISNATTSKLAFLNGEGEIYTIGDFRKEDGVLYSNNTYSYTFFSRGYKYGKYDYNGFDEGYYTGLEDYQWSYRKLMWIDEMNDEIVVNNKLEPISGEFAIDESGRVYEYNSDADVLTMRTGYRAYNSEFATLKFNEESEMTTLEIVAT